MRYWIIALPREDMEHCIRIQTFGMNRRGQLAKVEAGDGVVCYVVKDRKIIGLGEVTDPYYLDDSNVFLKDGVFPDRFKFKAKQFKRNDEFDFMEVVDKLDFIKKPEHWSVYLRNGFAELTKKDWDLVCKKTNCEPIACDT